MKPCDLAELVQCNGLQAVVHVRSKIVWRRWDSYCTPGSAWAKQSHSHAHASIGASAWQPGVFTTRVVDAGNLANFEAGRLGRASSSPPQLGHWSASVLAAHDTQKVHSNEQMRASVDSGGKSLLQHSQLGRSSSIRGSSQWCNGIKAWMIAADRAL